MKLLLSLLLSCLVGNVLAVGNLRKAGDLDAATLDKLSRGGEFTYEELGIQDDREAGKFCDSLMSKFLAQLPSYFTCGCRVRPLARLVVLKCSTEYCLPSDFNGIDLSATCLNPTYTGKLKLPALALSSEVCNPPITFKYNDTNDAEQTVTIQKACATAEHVPKQFDHFKSCGLTIGSYSCPCTVCSSGQDVTINCTGATSLGPLAPYAAFECIGLSLFNGAGVQVSDADLAKGQPALIFVELAEKDGAGSHQG